MTLNPPPTHPAAVLRLRCDACPPADRLIEHLASSESSGVSSGPALPDRLLSHAAHAARFLALAGGVAMKALLTTIVALVAEVALAQQFEAIAYPAKGQSASQQAKDKGECAQWSQKLSGFEAASAASVPSGARQVSTTYAPALPARPPALSGLPTLPRLPLPSEPPASAALDAARQNFEQAQREFQQRSAREGQHDTDARAIAACMEARGYVVK
jgi:hypothetical protein